MTTTLDSEQLSSLVAAAYADAPAPLLQATVNALLGCTEAEAMALLSLAPNPTVAMGWWSGGNDRGQHWPPLQPALQRWQDYCTQVHGVITGEGQQGSNAAVFGCCVRCGSSRLFVINVRGERD